MKHASFIMVNSLVFIEKKQIIYIIFLKKKKKKFQIVRDFEFLFQTTTTTTTQRASLKKNFNFLFSKIEKIQPSPSAFVCRRLVREMSPFQAL